MSKQVLTLHRKDLKIEGNRDLYSYSFTNEDGEQLTPEPTLPMPPERSAVPAPPAGNLNPEQGENRKG